MSRTLESPVERGSSRGLHLDTEVAAYLLAPTDGSYELEKLFVSYFNEERLPVYLEKDAWPLAETRRRRRLA